MVPVAGDIEIFSLLPFSFFHRSKKIELHGNIMTS